LTPRAQVREPTYVFEALRNLGFDLCGNQPLSREIHDEPEVLFSRLCLNRFCPKVDEMKAEGCLFTRVEEKDSM